METRALSSFYRPTFLYDNFINKFSYCCVLLYR